MKLEIGTRIKSVVLLTYVVDGLEVKSNDEEPGYPPNLPIGTVLTVSRVFSDHSNDVVAKDKLGESWVLIKSEYRFISPLEQLALVAE